MSASQVVSSSSTQSELFNFNHPLSPESVSGHSSASDSSSGSDERSSSQSHSHHSPLSTASHHSQNHHNGVYPTTEQQQQQQGQPVTKATPTNNTLPERPLVPTCPADWEAKKDIIYDLYMNKNFILNDVVEIMLSTHRFKATYALSSLSMRQLADFTFGPGRECTKASLPNGDGQSTTNQETPTRRSRPNLDPCEGKE